ncbi:MAG: ATP-binding protein [Deltaproteobacteria bacterium]|nr:ATP-binding protein [Deltaproteobacteria bacterium]
MLAVTEPLRVLFVEDDPADAELEVRALAAAGFRCAMERVDSEAALVAQLDAETYDLVISDYNLPAFNGLRALAVVRERGLDVPFILVSGALGEEAAIESLKLGATDYVLKGRLDRLPPVVRRALRDTEERRQRARAEAALRESEERYRSLVESAPDVILTLAPDDTFSSLNPAFEQVLGWSTAEWLGRSFLPLLHPDDAREAPRSIAAVRAGTPQRDIKLRVRSASGDYRIVELTATLQARDGEAPELLGVARDVTARVRAEAKMRTLVEIAKELSGTPDLQRVLERLTGRIARAIPCDLVALFTVEPDGGATRLIAQQGLPAERLAEAAALRFQPGSNFDGTVRSGQTIVLSDTATAPAPVADLFRRFNIGAAVIAPLRWQERHFGGLLLGNDDVRPFAADQVELGEAVARQIAGALEAAELHREQQNEARVSSALARVGQELISSIHLPVLLERLCRITTEVLRCDVTYTFLRSDDEDALLPVAGYGDTPERWEMLRTLRIPGRPVAPLMARIERDDIVQMDTAMLTELVPADLLEAYDLRRFLAVAVRRGSAMVGVHVAALRGEGAFSPQQQRIARGIAQLASLALENGRLVNQLEQANRLKSDFLATMSHELRTPLNVILGYNELLLDEVFGALTPEQAASLDRVGTSARELLELINATLDISRLETGRAALNLADLDTSALLREIEAETRSLREKPGVESVWRIAPDLPHVYSDGVKLKVLVKNLVANAFKFTDRGSVTVTAAAHDGWLELGVADTGIGMSADTLAVIFEPFRQGDSSSTRRHGGVGLGLYIVTRLLDLLGGRVEVQSQPGVGSTFQVWVPIDALRQSRRARA